MGIPGFFKFVQKQYPGCICLSNKFKKKIDLLYFDLNGIIHNSKHNNIDIMFFNIKKKIESIISFINPGHVFLYVDGVAPMAKITQQRSRRFKNITPKNEFDGNAITPGTEFMHKLNYFMKEFSSKYGYYYSGSDEPGEGEHKIMEHIRSLNNSLNIMIYGSDADLIMLGLVSHKPNFFIYREAEEVHIINLKMFKFFIKKDLLINDSFNYERIIDDWVFLCFLIGNDFLPHLPGVQIKNINILFELHKNIILRTNKYLTNKGSISLDNIKIIFEYLNLLVEEKTPNYYRKNFLLETQDNYFISNIVDEYCKGLMWVLHYYYKGCPDWEWFYPFYYAPLIKDFFLAEKNISFNLSKPLKELEQLLCVIPIQSNHLLPKKFADLMISKKSTISDFYPIKFKGMDDWRKVAVLPFIDLKRLRTAIKNI